jgi:hypothetical protein
MLAYDPAGAHLRACTVLECAGLALCTPCGTSGLVAVA